MFSENHWEGSLGGTLIAMAMTYLLALQHQHSHPLGKAVQWSLLAVSFTLIGVIWHNLSRILHYQITWQELISSEPLVWVGGSSYGYALLIAWAGLYFSMLYFLEGKQKELEAAQSRSMAKEAQLQSLRYQLNPHFLFNVLNSIDVAVLEDKKQSAHEMLVKLSNLLRSTLEQQDQDKIKLSEELKVLKYFTDIEQQRFAEKIDVAFQSEVDAERVYVPPMLLQPLLENALKFSWHHKGDKWVRLEFRRVDASLVILITNPLPDDSVQAKGTGTGLKNVQARLGVIYGETANLKYQATADTFSLTVILPWEEAL